MKVNFVTVGYADAFIFLAAACLVVPIASRFKLGSVLGFYFKREMFDSSLDMAKEVMVWLGKRESDIEFKAAQFKRHDEEMLKKSFEFFDDEPALVSYSKTRRAELEAILRSDGNREAD